MRRFGLGLLVILSILLAIPVFGQGMYEAWVARYNGPVDSTDVATAIRVDGSGNACVTGSSYGIGTDRDYLTIKYSPAGDSLWTRRYNGPGNGSDMANALSVDGSGNVCVAGGSWGGGTIKTDFATIKYYSNGDLAWSRRYSSPADSDDVAHTLAVDNSGNVYVAGVAARDYATVKYDSSGSQLWAKTYNGTLGAWDEIWAMTVDDSGNVYVTGESEGLGSSDLDYVTIKYYSNGDTAWIRRYNGPGDGFDVAHAIAVDDSGNVYVTGSSEGSGTSNDIATIKYHPNGDTAWLKRYNGTGNGYDGALSITLDVSRNVYVAGSTYSGPATIDDYVIIKYYPNGDTAWARIYNGPPNGYDAATAVRRQLNQTILVII